jgi:NAD(P)-dependent dehydrogenase (short-subunit alcohol dehydrogenase family)
MKKVLITGAGTGFGFEAARRLAEKGFDVAETIERIFPDNNTPMNPVNISK